MHRPGAICCSDILISYALGSWYNGGPGNLCPVIFNLLFKPLQCFEEHTQFLLREDNRKFTFILQLGQSDGPVFQVKYPIEETEP